MSKHSFKKIDQKEYLKKYLSGDKVKKKKKDKKHKKSKKSTVKIVDDDITHVECGIKIDEELLLVGEDAPQIVGEYVEERPQENDKFSSKWKSIVVKEEPNNNEDVKNEDLWGHKGIEFNIKKEKRSITPERFTCNENYQKNKNERNGVKFHKSDTLGEGGRHSNIKSLFYGNVNLKNKDGQSQQCEHRRNSTPDQSPPRKYASKDQRHSDQVPNRRGSPLTSQRRQRLSSSDQSPPRKQIISSNEKNQSLKSSRFQREESNDQSPPRHKDRENLKSRRHHRTSSSDQSPPRKQTNTSNEKSKSLNSWKHQSELSNDHAPPKHKERSAEGRQDLKSRRRRHSSSSNQSPQRKPTSRSDERNEELKSRHRHNSSSNDQSPRRRQKDRSRDNNQDLRSRRNHYSPSCDRSPERRERNSKNHQLSSEKDCNKRVNCSPSPQKIKRNNPFTKSPPNISSARNKSTKQSPSPPPTHKPKSSRTLDGKKAGLQDAAALLEETAERRLKEQAFFEQMPGELSGRNAEVQVRSTGRLGRKARMAREENSAERKIREAKEQETKLKYERWGKGLKQIEDYRLRKAEEAYESSKPLARYANDEDLDKYLREKEYAEDPMLEYMRQKRKEKETQSNTPKKPIYEGPYPENRFGIRPGYRWDGVDRSNGYEKKWLTVQNERLAKEEEAYKYSVEDM